MPRRLAAILTLSSLRFLLLHAVRLSQFGLTWQASTISAAEVVRMEVSVLPS